MTSSQDISLYIHVPFCTKKCHYCHFFVIPDKDIFKQIYLQALHLEWLKFAPIFKKRRLISIYFGGGTPALLGPQVINEILNWIKKEEIIIDKSIEITLEANPENISYELMQSFFSVGINRVSIGIQSLDSHLLNKLGRIHTAKKALSAIEETVQAGISNLSIDLMYDLPGQSLETWKNTLKEVKNLPITHLSLYNLTIEPQTVFFKYKDSLIKQMPNQEESYKMYAYALETLESFGLKQYEISAFSKNNLISKHNIGYWIGREFIGIGPSAFSFFEGSRFRNIAHLNRYAEFLNKGGSPIDFEEKLKPEASRRELLVIQLRTLKGVDLKEFESRYGPLTKEDHETINRNIEKKLLNKMKDTLTLTKDGILFYDTIAEDLI